MQSIFNKIAWYPPAEYKIPWSAILSSFAGQSGDFKDDLRDYLNVNHCILGESARALLFKLLEALKEQDNSQRDEVLIPGYTCYSVAAAIAKAGLKISAYDMDPATMYPDLDSFERAVSEKTLAVVTQHLFGIPTPISDVKSITHKYGGYLIEDAAQSLADADAEKAPGTMGDFGLYSFGRGKPLPIGGGGALVSQSHSEIFEQSRLGSPKKGFKQLVAIAATQIASKPVFYWIPELLPLGLGKTIFNPDFDVEAMPNAINKISSAALSILNQLNVHRKWLSGVYSKHLSKKYQIENSELRAPMIRFPVMLSNNASLTMDLNRLGVRKMYPKAISDENLIRPYLRQNQMPTPGSTEISKRLVTLPTHMGVGDHIAKKITILLHETAI
jgi:dTDP-4-amino-4,6-dideoxygalactose transaminase